MAHKFSYAAAAAAALLLVSPAYSADDQQGSKALHEVMSKGMDKMHNMKMTGKTDHDFASMMIQHHEQAIAMSKVELERGADPEVQKKAREIIAASEKDIADLKKWQKQHH